MTTVEITPSHAAAVGGLPVRRALPRAGRRTIGAWCFVDHMGPAPAPEGGLDVGPHPHIGLQTVTWLIEGEAIHRDSLGTEQTIRPGQLNLMTAGHGIAHAEERMGAIGRRVHGVQFWVAQPEATRHGPPAFEHHAALPQFDLDNAVLTVLVGELGGLSSSARRDSVHFGADVDLRAGRTVVGVDATHEHGVVVVSGAVRVGDQVVEPGALAYLPPGKSEIVLDAREPSRAVLFGGEPFPERLSMFWNFVARDHAEIDAAVADWHAGTDRFAPTSSDLERIPSPRPPWHNPAAPAGG